MNHASQPNGIAAARRRLAAVAALGFLTVPALLGTGCAAPPSGTDTEGQIGQATQNLTQCVTFQRGASGTVADAMLSSPPAGQNYGTSPILRVGGKDESLLRFDLSSIPASAVVNSATLKLYVNGSAGDLGVNIHAATAAWSEGTVTFGSFNQQYANGVSGVLLPSSPNALKSADVTALVASWVSGAQANNGMLLETSDKKKSIFVSSDAGGSAQRPALTVCYTTPDDHCAPNPCANGSCQNGASGYTCSCDAGWTGTNCDVNMHQCDDQPCQNGATCTNQPNGYTCACIDGFAGDLSLGVRRELTGQRGFVPFVRGGVFGRVLRFQPDDVTGAAAGLELGFGVRAAVRGDLSIAGGATAFAGLAHLTGGVGDATQLGLTIGAAAEYAVK